VAVGCPRLSSAASVTLAWDQPTDGITTGYILFYGTTSQSYSQQIDVGGVAIYTVSGLTDGTTYYFAVRAYDALGELSAPSAEVSVTVGSSVPPVVTSLALTASLPSPQMIGTTVMWSSTATGGVAPYQFQWAVYSAGSWTVGPWTVESTWAWTPALPETDYQVMVAVRSSGSSSSSGELSQTVPFTITALLTSPAPFSKSTPATGTTRARSSLTLSWALSSGATSYEYCVDTTNDGSCDTEWTTTPTITASPSGLAPSTTYWWQVRALNATGTTEADSGTWWSFTTRRRR
jgi:large repetitive protein